MNRLLQISLIIALIPLHALAQETQRQYLSGKGIDDAVQWEFFCSAGNKSGTWSTIPVPSCWDVEGFGKLTYGRGEPEHSKEQGKYRYRFQAPANWQGQQVYLVFEGAMTDTQATLNGESVGEKHHGAYYAFRYDVTKLVKLGGENVLEVTVDKESEIASVNNAERRADYWNFGGIFRPVYLEAVPQQHIERVAIDAKADGAFAMDAFTIGAQAANTIQSQVMDLAGNPVGAAFTQSLADGKAKLTAKIEAPKQWTAETPNLYQVEVRLMQGNNVVHRIRQRFGFRTIEVRKGDGVYVNGQRILLKGTNRHSFWPESGRATSERLSKLDVQVMKEMNNNAVRMSHYPPDAHFLDMCDEMGLYVLDELAGWHQAYDSTIGRKLIGEMIAHDVNHPSILFWDNGNEGGWNKELDDDFAKWDPQQREVLHPWDPFRNMDTKHYLSYDGTKQRCEGTIVFMPTEFLHGLFDGGGAAGLNEYWEVMRNSKVCAGGFLWAYADETVKRKDLNGKMDTAGNQAPDGIVGPYREKEGSFYTVKQIWSPIVVSRNNNELTIENRYDFTNANQCTFTFQVRKFRSPFEQGNFEVLTETVMSVGSIPPHGKGTVAIKSDWPQGDALAVRVNDPNGLELWTWVWPTKTPKELAAVHGSRTAGAVTAKEEGDSIDITAGNLTVKFSKQTGYLTSAVSGGKSFTLANGPRLATGTATVAKVEHRADGADHLVEVTYTGNMKSARWRIKSDGWVEAEYDYNLTGPHDFFGVSFDLPEKDVKSMRWLGNGPFRVWRNRLLGGSLNVWQNNYNDTMTGYSDLIYPEFKGFYSDVRWMRLETTNGPILVAIDDPALYVQVLQPRFPGDPKPGQNAQQILSGNAWAMIPEAGFSLLQAIPPVGSKFVRANSSGPMGQTPVAGGDYHGSFRLFFGDPN